MTRTYHPPADRLWPICPTHGDLIRRALAGWVYCDRHGWHPETGNDK
jgi:hypothetical protein